MDNWQRAWVIGTSCLIGFISYSSQIFIIWPWYGSVLSLELLKLLIPFNLCVGMIWWNYWLVVKTPPGSVPLGYRPNMQGSDHIELKRGSNAPRFCKMCEHYKPPRAHHCRQCKTCVLKLDHHCPWVANCVGFYNQGHFIRFLLWVDISTSFHLLMMVARVRSMYYDVYNEPTLQDVLMLVFNFSTCVPVWLCVGGFSIYHLILASGNTTTIERWEKDKVATMVRRGKIKEITYPYNVGFKANLKSVLGDNPWLWLWPQPMNGDGLSFPVSQDAGEAQVQYSWPPRDPTAYHPDPVAPGCGNPFVYGNGFNPALVPSSGAQREDSEGSDSEHSGSSPEPYLSDYDDDIPLAYTSSRVRRGSEGWEVRPAPGWATGMGPRDGQMFAKDVEHFSARPWERPGRYKVYVPGED